MHHDFTLLYPPLVRFGWGCRSEAPAALARMAGGPLPRTFVVCSRSVRGSGILDEMLGADAVSVCGVFDAVPHDPPLTCVDALIERLRLSSAEAVLAIGGGSVIDAAKAAAAVAPEADHVRPFFEGTSLLRAPGLPLAALPTTAGTGAEITKNAVLSDHARGAKASLRSPFMVPAAAFIDPQLTVSMPPDLTACSGLDALTQAVESYLSTAANSVTRPLAAAAVDLLMRHLVPAYLDGCDREAREGVAKGSLLSALAFSQSGLGAVHGLAHPIGHVLGLPHGFVCAVLLPHVLEWNACTCGGAMGELAAVVGTAAAADFTASVAALCHDLGIPAGFAGHGLGHADHRAIIEHCRGGSSMKVTPRPMSNDDVADLLARLSSLA